MISFDKIINLNHKSLVSFLEKSIIKYSDYENFKTIMKWNRSLFFGISVGKLSDMIEYY